MNLEKDQIVILELTGNAKRRSSDKYIQATVKTINKKYITVSSYNCRDIKFDVECNYQQKTDICIDYILHENLEKYLESLETKELYSKIRKEFDNYTDSSNFTLEQLKKIETIIFSKND